MHPLADYIAAQPYPRKTSAARSLGVDLTQLKRWTDAGAYIINGTVYVPAKQQRNRRQQ